MAQHNLLGFFAPSMTNKWTDAAIECYQNGCNCANCIISKIILSQKCYMKACVNELIRKNIKDKRLHHRKRIALTKSHREYIKYIDSLE